MTKIQSYNDLLKERERLELLLHAQKDIIHNDISELKETFRPLVTTVSEVSKVFTRSQDSLLVNGVANLLIDLIFKKFILSRASWITRQAIPFFLKNYSSHFVSGHKSQIFRKLFSLFSGKNGREEVKSETPE